VDHTCNGTVNFTITYEDGKLKNVTVDGVSAPKDAQVNTPTTELQRFHFTQDLEPYAGENGIIIDNERHHAQLIPGGKSGSNVVHLFDYNTRIWSTVDVYCQPLGLTYRQESDEIVGFCAVNTTYGPITCMPYFTLRVRNDKWVDVSQSGSCSQSLSTANVTNAVILQSDSDYEVDETRLYFAERGTNRLHELSLSQKQTLDVHEVDTMLKIDHLIPVSNASFLGLRVVCRTKNSPGYYQKSFLWQLDSTQQQQTGFTDGFVRTESIAFDSYNLSYLVTFSVNHNTVIVKEDGESMQHPLMSTLDDPIQCQNLVGPTTHYLICLVENGLPPLLVNVTHHVVTTQTIPANNNKYTVKTGMLTESLFYVLDDRQELSIYLIASSIINLGSYALHPNIDFIITLKSSNINCINEESADFSNSNNDKSHSLVTVIVASIVGVVAIAIIFVIVVVIIIIIHQKIMRNHRNVSCKYDIVNDSYKNNTLKNINGNHYHNDNTTFKGTHDDAIPIIQQPTTENCDTGQRNVTDPPTNSIDPCEEASGNQEGMMVHANFPNPEPIRMLQNESSQDETQYVEASSEQCIDPLECAEDNLPPRQDPVGDPGD